jgi:dGTPase
LSRDHPEPLEAVLPPLVLDRQRVVQSAAFRRLQQKTQVFLTLENDHFRTRLTHTLEVAHLARCLAVNLA